MHKDFFDPVAAAVDTNPRPRDEETSIIPLCTVLVTAIKISETIFLRS